MVTTSSLNPRRRVLLVGLILAALATAFAFASTGTANAATATDYTYNHDLRWWVHQSLELASYGDYGRKVIPQPVEVRCYSSTLAFDRAAYEPGDTLASLSTTEAFWAGGNTINMRTLTCSQAERFVHGIITPTTAEAFETLLHESLHRQGIRTEALAEEYAIAASYDAGRFVRYERTLELGGTPAWDGPTVTASGLEARDYALYANRYRPAAYRTTLKGVEAAQSLGWPWAASRNL
jgi:hypothetical protein